MLPAEKETAGREARKLFRELARPKWTKAFHKVILDVTAETNFTYIAAVTWFKGDRAAWEEEPEIQTALRENPIRLLTLKDILNLIESKLTKTPAASKVGRLVH